jgi:riboflavin kinase / FMN adenylyltransferase
VFDGLHRGHQMVIEQVRTLAQRHGALASVATFDPHPGEVLDPTRAPLRLATLEQRLEGLERLGVEQVRVLRFDETLAAESADSFIERVLVTQLRSVAIVVGEDFHFGHARAGDVTLLRARQHLGYVVAPAPLAGDGERFSSSAVRRHLLEGHVARATEVLGRPFTLRGTVAHGDERGRDLGFPTANVATGYRQALPAMGIYAGAARVPGGEWYPAAISVGRRPQFYEAGECLVEAHLLDFAGDLYEAPLDVAFVAHLRAEAVFDGLEALVAQMGADVAATREIYKSFSPDASVLLG